MGRRLPLVLGALGALLLTQITLVRPASAVPISTADWWIPAFKQANEVLTVDAIGNAEPFGHRTWDRASVCMVFIGVDGCVTSRTANGLTRTANDDGTVTVYRHSTYATYSGFTLEVRDSTGEPAVGYVDLRESASSSPLVGDPDPAVRARLRTTQSVSPTTFDFPGRVLTWTSVVSNTGNVDLEHLAVTDGSSRVSARTCAPVAIGSTLAAGASTTCTATLVTTRADLDNRADRTDQVIATGTATRGGIVYRASTAGTASSAAVQFPRIALDGWTSPTTTPGGDRAYAYTVRVHNYGNVAARDLVVRAPFPGLSGLVCSPVQLGQALEAGSSTTCTGTRLVAGLAPGNRTEVVKATAKAANRAVNATFALSLDVPASSPTTPTPSSTPPVARPDVATTTVGHPVTVDVLANDAPSNGLVGTSVRLRLTPDLPPGSVLYGDAKSLVVAPVPQPPFVPVQGGVVFLVSGQGEITVVPLDDKPAGPVTVGYQVADAQGRTTRSSLKVTITG